MDFDKKSHEIFRNWYIDGRLYYLKVIDQKNPQEGIQDLRYIDPMKIKYVRQEKKTNGQSSDPYVRINSKEDAVPNPKFDEYYIYTMKPNYPTGMIAQAGKRFNKNCKRCNHILYIWISR